MPPGDGSRCIFCEIVAGRAPSYLVYQDDFAVAFLDIFPFTRGHLLVVPRHHVDRLIDLPKEQYTAFLHALAEVCRRVERLSHHYNVSTNQGELAGQIIFHLHFHVIPRYGEENPFRSRPHAPLGEDEAREIVRFLSSP
ncbi:MAG: HIT family protein [Thermoplasmata archaeon]